jgi:hypothetical protein
MRRFQHIGISVGLGLLLVFLALSQAWAYSTGVSEQPALLPLPQKLVWNDGDFSLNIPYVLQYDGDKKDLAYREIMDILRNNGNREEESVAVGRHNRRFIQVSLSKEIPGLKNHSEEGYLLNVSKDSVSLRAATSEGLFRGVQTLRQLVVSENGKSFIAGCQIVDWPAFRIRGFMQDVGRNFMPVSLLKEQIDVMSAYKFNVFHLHLTDNEGWRLESKKFPQLNSPSSMSRWKGKYYTQKEFIDLVDYCNRRYITLIPEFDVPGHCEAFRKAFAIDSMSDLRVKPIMTDLLNELCGLVSCDKMPYIHLGTDEVWHNFEKPAPGLLAALIYRLHQLGRQVIVWRPGIGIPGDSTSITQLWSSTGKPRKGHRYIDSRLNYLNHLDALGGISQLYFDRICQSAHGDSPRMGGILCCWNDNNVQKPSDILSQNPVYPGMLTYSETSWKGQSLDFGTRYLAKLPPHDSNAFLLFQKFEERLIQHRDRYFKGKPFPYVKQTDVDWRMIGPFDNGGDLTKRFPVEDSLKASYHYKGKDFCWSDSVYSGTIFIRHFFGYPSYFQANKGTVYAETNIWSPQRQSVGFWIGFFDWSRSGGRRGGPLPNQGLWLKTHPIAWVNKRVIPAPKWNNPGLRAKSAEIPFTDENYYYRSPTFIMLKKGWNHVLLKVPEDGSSWKWMFTFIPVKVTKEGVREVTGLKFCAKLMNN